MDVISLEIKKIPMLHIGKGDPSGLFNLQITKPGLKWLKPEGRGTEGQGSQHAPLQRPGARSYAFCGPASVTALCSTASSHDPRPPAEAHLPVWVASAGPPCKAQVRCYHDCMCFSDWPFGSMQNQLLFFFFLQGPQNYLFIF